MTERSKKFLNNTIWSVIANGVSVIAGFVIRSFFINQLGVEYLGFNGVVTSLLNTLNIAELGFDQVFNFFLYKPFAQDDIKRTDAILCLFKKVYRYVGFTILLFGIIFSLFFKIFLKEEIPENINVYLVFYLYLIRTVLSYLLFAYKRSVLYVDGRFDITNKINAIGYLLLYGFQIISLFYFKNYYLYVICFIVSEIFVNIVLSVIVSKLYPNLSFEGTLEKQFYPEFFKKTAGIAFTRFRSASRSYADTLFVSSFLGLYIAGKYNIYCTVYMVPQMVLYTIIFPSLTGVMGNYFAVNSLESCWTLFKTYTFAMVWILTFFCCCFLCFVQNFVVVWVGGDVLLPVIVPVTFCFLIYIWGIAGIAETIKNITGIVWENRFCPLVEICLNVILNFIGIKLFGVAGIVIATAISIGCTTLPSDFYVCLKYFFKKPFVPFMFVLVGYFLLAVLIVSGTYFVCIPLKWCRLPVCLLLPNLVIFLFFYKTGKVRELLTLFGINNNQ